MPKKDVLPPKQDSCARSSPPKFTAQPFEAVIENVQTPNLSRGYSSVKVFLFTARLNARIASDEEIAQFPIYTVNHKKRGTAAW